jgi:hypothetical protein
LCGYKWISWGVLQEMEIFCILKPQKAAKNMYWILKKHFVNWVIFLGSKRVSAAWRCFVSCWEERSKPGKPRIAKHSSPGSLHKRTKNIGSLQLWSDQQWLTGCSG